MRRKKRELQDDAYVHILFLKKKKKTTLSNFSSKVKFRITATNVIVIIIGIESVCSTQINKYG